VQTPSDAGAPLAGDTPGHEAAQDTAAAAPAAPAADAPEAGRSDAAQPAAFPKRGGPRRFAVEASPLPPAGPTSGGQRPVSGLANAYPAPGKRFLIVDDGRGVALDLAVLLEQRGAEALVTAAPSAVDLVLADAFVHLGALRPGGRPLLPGAFGQLRDALAARVHTVLVATVGGGTFGGGSAAVAGGGSRRGPARGGPSDTAVLDLGSMRSGDGQSDDRGEADGWLLGWTIGDVSAGHQHPADEWSEQPTMPGMTTEPIDLGLRGLIRTIAAEHPGVLARAVDVEPKHSSREIAAQLFAELTDQAGPAVVGYLAGQRTGLRMTETPALPVPSDPPLDADSVVLITGGARGVTATVAIELARATGCHVELLGRTPPPGPEDPELDTPDPVELRRLLASTGFGDRREIEAEAGRLLRVRRLRNTLAELRETAASVHYHAVDVRNTAAVSGVLGEVYVRAGRLDGVIHGAGALAGRASGDKTPESFAHAYTTRVDGARALAAGLRGSFRFFVLLGGLPGARGVPGFRGLAGYAAANDAYDALATQWPDAPAGRVVGIDWDTAIEPERGVGMLLAEIAKPAGPGQVAYLSALSGGQR
jgi:NAD(P)-dependent dehydrogenase (short-subunit alcohol dehydrogenase family)